jgi:phthiocerol/phenolphthiocerol synthesis type-I polyketide synthase E
MLEQTSEKIGTAINSESIISTSFSKTQRTAKLRSMSSLIKEHSVQKIDLLKVDVEKAEWDVLMGIDEEDWPKIQQVVVEVHDLDGRVDAVHRLLQDKGFTKIGRQASTHQDFSFTEN